MQVSEKEQEAQQWKKLYDKEVSDRQLAIKDLNTVQQYLTEMPSKDEIRKKADEISFYNIVNSVVYCEILF